MTEENKETLVEKSSQEAVSTDKTVTEPPTTAADQVASESSAAEPAQPAEERKEVRSVLLSSFGGIKSVKLAKIPEPTSVAEDEVAIRVSAA
jgi:hypothetical protein